MNDLVGQQNFVASAAADLKLHLEARSPDVLAAISEVLSTTDFKAVEAECEERLQQLTVIHAAVRAEEPMGYVHYASRIAAVGFFQSALAFAFADIPAAQGYGFPNPLWVLTPVEEAGHAVVDFFHRVARDMHVEHRSVLVSLLSALRQVAKNQADYPEGIPETITFDDECSVALLADWGGDNPAARKVAETVKSIKPAVAIHLGDIYYAGTKLECEAFLKNWPWRMNAGSPMPNANLALNGNHEMYTGGESYFKVVLQAFEQRQPFFCMQNTHWRVIGLDTAYNGGRLKPADAQDPLTAQWHWLTDLLRDKSRATILLSHHQPVSAHKQEHADSQHLRNDVNDLLAQDGVGENAIFGWFFGHEHRCAIYDNNNPDGPYNARLIGSGCIPHVVQREVHSDDGCTPATFFSRRSEPGSAENAISMYAELRFEQEHLTITYHDDDYTDWGYEIWYADRGRLNGVPFLPANNVDTTR